MAFTVTATQGGAGVGNNGMQLRVKVLTGAALGGSQTGNTATQFGTAAHQASITTTVTGSEVYGSAWCVDNGTSYTANGNTTGFDDNVQVGLRLGTCRSTSATGTPGAVSIGYSSPSNNNGNLALAEILPSGTITEDASSPASVNTGASGSVTTASFTPPNGALLVAMISTNGGAGVATVTMSDTSGLSLTWTALVQNNPSSGAYSGVQIAQMPTGSVSGAVSALALAAPAGTLEVDAAIAGLAVNLALAAPAGTTASNPVPGLTGLLALAAPAGSVSASGRSRAQGDYDRTGAIRKPWLW